MPPTGTQVPIKQRLQTFGERRTQAVGKELLQIHLKNTFTPQKFHDLTVEQQIKALETLFFLVEKRSGDIEGQMVANGWKQRTYIGNLEVTLPTIVSDSVMLTAATKAAEKRDVAVIGLPGAFLSADMDELVHVVLRGELAELMVETAQEICWKYVTCGRKRGSALCNTTKST